MDSPQNIISLCTGYGGIELGIKRVVPAIRTVCYVEIEAFAIANLVTKIEKGQMDTAPVWTNLKSFDGQPFRGKVHGIIGGYPCQPFSNAGKRRGKEDPRHLWPYIEEHIRTIRPLWCFFENVGGHLTLGFDEVYKSLRDLGYKVEAGLFTAAEVGAPHKRERLFIYASDRSSGYMVNTDSNDVKKIGRGTGQRARGAASGMGGVEELAYSGEPGAGNINRQIDGRDRSEVLRQGNRQACTSGTNSTSSDGREILAYSVNSTSRPDTGGNAETDRLPCQCGQEVCSGQLEGASKQLGNTRCIGQTQRQEQTARAVESSQELANAELFRRRRRDNGEPGRQGRSLQAERSGELANGNGFGCFHSKSKEQSAETGVDAQRDITAGGRHELANTKSKRTQRDGTEGQQESDSQTEQGLSGRNSRGDRYPARPGQQQYDWEEPRTIKPGLGRTANGHSCRVDRLRLCGNGVCPDTAELAFETLTQQALENLHNG